MKTKNQLKKMSHEELVEYTFEKEKILNELMNRFERNIERNNRFRDDAMAQIEQQQATIKEQDNFIKALMRYSCELSDIAGIENITDIATINATYKWEENK